MQKEKPRPFTTSWEPVEKWYKELVGKEGHYYHQHVILPGITRLLGWGKNSTTSLLDLACGPGVLARHLPEKMTYTGVDISPGLVRFAVKEDRNTLHRYQVGDATLPLNLEKKDFDFATIILAIQNMEFPLKAFQNAATHLKKGGKLLLVLNHPCFRIPRQSSWQVDTANKIQYRRIDRYFSPLKIPIHANPSKGSDSSTTWSFHYPLSSYTQWLYESGFWVESMDEWCSNKESSGKNAKMENRSRDEFPLFLAILASKK